MNDAQEERKVLVDEYIHPMFRFIDPDGFMSIKHVMDGKEERIEVKFRQGHVKAMPITGLPLDRVLKVATRAAFG